MSDRKDDLRRQFGTVWRMASSSFDTLREVVVRSSQAGRLRVDVALLQRERSQLLQSFGERVAALVDAGQVQLPRELRALHAELRELETRMQSDVARLHDNAYGAPRGFEPEAGNYDDDGDGGSAESDDDEHAHFGASGRESR